MSTGITVEVTLVCTACADVQTNEIEPNEKAEDHAETEGWGYADDDYTLTNLLCPECLEGADEVPA